MGNLLVVRQLEKTYQSEGTAAFALRGVDLTITQGEFLALMGPSGCGKSTLLHLIGGLDRPTSGEIHLRSQRVDTLSEAKRARLRRREIGFLFQSFNLIDSLSVADNVELPALIAGFPSHEARRRREHLLERLGIAEKTRSTPMRLAGGEQQRVALARALICDPALLLADEPTGNLDSRNAREVMSLLHQAHSGGQTICLVTHDPGIASAADRVLLMRDGCVVDQTLPETKHGPQSLLRTLQSREMA